MDLQVLATVCLHLYGIHTALLFSVFLRTNHIIFGDYAANSNFHIRKDIRVGVRAALCKRDVTLSSIVESKDDIIKNAKKVIVISFPLPH